MALALAILSILIIALSMYGVLLPLRLVTLVRGFMQREAGLWIAVTIRLLLAGTLWFSAPASRTPGFFRVLSALMLLTAVTLPVVGYSRLNQFIAYIDSGPPWVIRLLCCLGVALGGTILWSISSPPTAF